MIKILRKYNKYILVGGMSLLMVAFLIPQGIQQLSDPRKRTVAHLGDKKISAGRFDEVQKEYFALEKYSPALVKRVLGVEGPEHWLLLAHEAEQGGFIGEAGDGTDWTLIEAITVQALAEERFGQFAQYALRDPQLSQQLMEQVRAILPQMKMSAMSVGLNEPSFNLAVAKARGVYRMMEAFQRATRYSDRRATVEKKEQLDAVYADAAIVPASRITTTIAEPVPQEIEAHFEKYRSTKAGEGEHGIGYTLPPRMKLEWLTLDRPAIEAAAKVDPVKANVRWRTNRTKYPGEYAAEKANVERDMRAEKVQDIIDLADRTVRAELKKTSSKLAVDKGYKQLPDDWSSKRPRLEAIAQTVADAVKASDGFDMPLPPVTVKAANWLTLEDVAALPEIGQSSIRSGSRSIPFSQTVFTVRELRSADAPGADLGLQVGLTSSDVYALDAEGRRYYFTILDVRPESAADTLDEVRTKVIEDIRRLKAYETLLSKASDLGAAAASGGVDAVAKTVDGLFPRAADAPALPPADEVKVLKNVVFLKEDIANGDPRLNLKALRDGVLATAAKLDPSKPGTEAPAADRTLTQGLPASLALAVVQIVQNRPLTAEKSRQVGEQAMSQLQSMEFRAAMAKQPPGTAPFSKEELTKRLAYRPEREPGETPPEPAPASDTAPSDDAKKGS